ncbi:MAG TPA: hypothetical protein VFY29_10785 [Terriglobia bacterium]|nr:hypothetical protein [Terriglobia bacterium]
MNLPNVLGAVFSTTRGDDGEMPFAIGKDGTVYTRVEEDRARVVALGPVATPDGPATARLDDWIVVTTPDPSGRASVSALPGPSEIPSRSFAAPRLAMPRLACSSLRSRSSASFRSRPGSPAISPL